MSLQNEGRNDRQWAIWPGWLVALHVVFAGALLYLAATWCAQDDIGNAPCLAWLSPLVDAIVAGGRRLVPYRIPRLAILPAAGVLLLVYLVARARTQAKAKGGAGEPSRTGRTQIPYAEVLCLELFTIVTVVYRFYVLNRLPSDSIAEVHFVYLASSDWHTLFVNNANEGAPLGLLHYLMAGGLWEWFGATMLTPRFAAAMTSVVVTQLIYWFGRSMGGPTTGLLAAAFYAFSPVEMAWSRHDMFPFANPSLLVLPLGAVTYLAVTRFRPRDWIGTALLMGASRHLFASGLAAFLAPVGTVSWLALFDWSRAKRCRWKLLWLVLGIALWAVGRSLAKFAGSGSWQWFNPYSAGLSSRGLTREGGGLAALRILGFNVEEIFRGLFLGGFELDHQTPMGAFAPMPWIPPLVAILFGVGLVWCILNRCDVRTGVLIPLIGVTILPALMSIPDAHRMAAAFPVICTLAALVAATGLAYVEAWWPTGGKPLAYLLPTAIITAMGSMAGATYFQQDLGEPPPDMMARAIRPFLRPHTLLILDVPSGLDTEEYYLLYDDMLRDQIAIVVPGRNNENPWPDVATKPHVLVYGAYYRETALRHQVPQIENAQWLRMVFILHELMDRENKVQLLRSLYPDARVTEVSVPTWRDGYDFTAVEVRNLNPLPGETSAGTGPSAHTAPPKILQ